MTLAPRLRSSVDSVREQLINLSTLVLIADEAKPLADRYLRRQWFEENYELGLTMRYVAIEPGDGRTLVFDGNPKGAFCEQMTFQADGVIRTQWERDDPAIHALSTTPGAEMEGRPPTVMPISSLTKGAILDMPLAIDGHNNANPFIYFAAGPYPGAYWAGAEILDSDTGAYDDYEPGWAAIARTDGMTWGYAEEALGDALPWVADLGNSLTVHMKNGELGSTTMAALLENPGMNLMALGKEFVQFATAELVDVGVYKVSNFLRGRRGTEAQTSAHAAGELVVVFDTKVFAHQMGADEIGDTDHYRAVSQGRELESAIPQAVTYTAAALMPYSPVNGILMLDTGTGDWLINATRRTRIGGANIDGQDVPLGETSESWSADILDGDDVVRVITGSSLPLRYLAADQIADWGELQTSLSTKLHQVSPALSLRGYPLAIAA